MCSDFWALMICGCISDPMHKVYFLELNIKFCQLNQSNQAQKHKNWQMFHMEVKKEISFWGQNEH
jgi:hypothetical protein